MVQAAEAGADIIEVGFPLGDAVADGPVIQESYKRVLARGQKNKDVFELVGRVRERTDVPLVAMVAFSLVINMGFERFLQNALDAGFDGAIIPDLPVEEAKRYEELCREEDFHLVSFATPATPRERREYIAEHARGFIYYISVRGITGERSELPDDLVENIRDLKSVTGLPVAVGFGMSTPDHARSAGQVADGVISGSAVLRRIRDAEEAGEDPVEAACEFIRAMSRAAKGLDESD
jgi:tryptophan synthase alpha chain